MIRAAHETDNGPGGVSWEMYDGHNWIASVGTRSEAERLGATEFHTLAEWYQFACDWCGETDVKRPVQEVCITPPVDGYGDKRLEVGRFHPECADQAARELVE